MTACILGALVIGKLLGITLLVLVASRVHCAPLNPKIRPTDVAMVASTASVGLTVALFVAGEAFPDPVLQGEAKLGALLSGLMGFVCIGASKIGLLRTVRARQLTERYLPGGHLAHRYGIFQRHRIRAGDNALHAHPDVLHHPRLLDVDRARARWRAAKQSAVATSGVVNFLHTETERHRDRLAKNAATAVQGKLEA